MTSYVNRIWIIFYESLKEWTVSWRELPSLSSSSSWAAKRSPVVAGDVDGVAGGTRADVEGWGPLEVDAKFVTSDVACRIN